MAGQFWLSDEQFECLLPRWRGRARVDDRRVPSGIIHVQRSGLRWCDAPAIYGPRKTLYNRHVRWTRNGVFARLFAALPEAADHPRRHRHLLAGEMRPDAKLSERSLLCLGC